MGKLKHGKSSDIIFSNFNASIIILSIFGKVIKKIQYIAM